MTTQLALFDSGPRVLVDDETGRIAYYPCLLAPQEASQLYAWLLENAPWSSETMWMYDHNYRELPRTLG